MPFKALRPAVESRRAGALSRLWPDGRPKRRKCHRATLLAPRDSSAERGNIEVLARKIAGGQLCAEHDAESICENPSPVDEPLAEPTPSVAPVASQPGNQRRKIVEWFP